MSKGITAVIPTRAGSERVRNKNTKRFSSSSLLQVKIDQMKKLLTEGLIDDVIVNTNCKYSEMLARKNNIRVVIREDYYASPACSSREYWCNVGNCIDTDIFMLAQVTSPLVKHETYKKCIEFFDTNSIMTATKVKEFLWKENKPINYEIGKQPRSQDLPDNIFRLNFAIGIISLKELNEYQDLVTPKTKFIFLDEVEGFDIDTELDFKIAEWLQSDKKPCHGKKECCAGRKQ